MENALPFIGIDPNDTDEVLLEKTSGRITIGVINQGLWERVSSEHDLLSRAAMRRITKWLVDNGEDPGASELDREGKPILINGEPLTKAASMIMSEPEYQERFYRLALRAAKYGVRSHVGFARSDGTEVTCELVDEKLDFGEVRALSPSTLAFYGANRMLLQVLWQAIRRLQTLGPREKKVSPPPSSAISAASAVAIAPSNPSSSG